MMYYDLEFLKMKLNKKGRQLDKGFFQTGDRVRLRYGSSPLKITYANQNYANARYESSGGTIQRKQRDFVKLTDQEVTENKGLNSMKDKLFQTITTGDDDTLFGVGLAVDSNGMYVLEMKDGSGVRLFDKKDVEIVMPYTFSIKWSTGPTEYQFLGKAGLVEVGDLLLAMSSKHTNGGIGIAQVVKVNTKSSRATQQFKGVKISTIPLDQE